MGEEDYWSEDFDQEQNCAQKERIAELQDKVVKSNTGYLTSELLPRDLTMKGATDCQASVTLRWSPPVITAIRRPRTRPVPSIRAR